jgi:hypothetical protein
MQLKKSTEKCRKKLMPGCACQFLILSFKSDHLSLPKYLFSVLYYVLFHLFFREQQKPMFLKTPPIFIDQENNLPPHLVASVICHHKLHKVKSQMRSK